MSSEARRGLGVWVSVLRVAAAARALGDYAPAGPLPPLSSSLGEARARTEGDRLVVQTGKMERVWRLTDKGLATVGLPNMAAGKEWAAQKPAYSCDWSVRGFVDERTTARLTSLKAKPVRLSPQEQQAWPSLSCLPILTTP